MKPIRAWFIAHSIIDILFAIPLIFFPTYFLAFLNIHITQPLFAQLVGAALIGIGGVSFITKKSDYNIMLNLKILWGISAILILLYALLAQNAPKFFWVILITFIVFVSAWIYFKRKLQKGI